MNTDCLRLHYPYWLLAQLKKRGKVEKNDR